MSLLYWTWFSCLTLYISRKWPHKTSNSSIPSSTTLCRKFQSLSWRTWLWHLFWGSIVLSLRVTAMLSLSRARKRCSKYSLRLLNKLRMTTHLNLACGCRCSTLQTGPETPQWSSLQDKSSHQHSTSMLCRLILERHSQHRVVVADESEELD